MTIEEIKDTICGAFSGVMETNQFIVLECTIGSTLQQTKSQILAAEVAIERRGALYLCEVSRTVLKDSDAMYQELLYNTVQYILMKCLFSIGNSGRCWTQ